MADSGLIEVDGGRIYHEVEGEGHPLLLIHGGLGDLRMWDDQVPVFAERYRVIRYDTRGFGRTETDDVEFWNHADAAAVLDHLGAGSAYVVGQSRGGGIALDLAIDRPDRVDALVSVAGGIAGYEGPEPPGAPPWDEMERLWEAKEWEALAELDTKVWVDGWGQPPDRIDSGLREKVRGWILAAYLAEKPYGKPQRLDPPAAERLGDVDIPMLVLIGQVDEPAAPITERHLASSVAGAQVVEFPGVAHMIHLEEPERFNNLVLEYLATVSPVSDTSGV